MGIKYSGDIARIASGADCVMVGSLLAGTDESPGDNTVPAETTSSTGMGSPEREGSDSTSVPREKVAATRGRGRSHLGGLSTKAPTPWAASGALWDTQETRRSMG